MRRIAVLALLFVFSLALFAQNRKVKVLIETSVGDITVRLYDDTPIHRDNFVKLVREGFYDQLLFHRVIKGFMIQSGDPDSRNAAPGTALGEGDPGYTLPAEICLPNYYHRRGALAAAREADDVNPERRSSGSQFYIVWGKTLSASEMRAAKNHVHAMTGGEAEFTPTMHQDYSTLGGAPHLDGQYTVFGEVTAGLKTVKAIQKVRTDKNDRPLEDIKILRATIVSEK